MTCATTLETKNKKQEMWQEALEPSCELMSKEGLTKTPRFSVGDCVVAVGPSIAYCGHQGVVIEIIEPAGDLVYRYVVRFAQWNNRYILRV